MSMSLLRGTYACSKYWQEHVPSVLCKIYICAHNKNMTVANDSPVRALNVTADSGDLSVTPGAGCFDVVSLTGRKSHFNYPPVHSVNVKLTCRHGPYFFEYMSLNQRLNVPLSRVFSCMFCSTDRWTPHCVDFSVKFKLDCTSMFYWINFKMNNTVKFTASSCFLPPPSIFLTPKDLNTVYFLYDPTYSRCIRRECDWTTTHLSNPHTQTVITNRNTRPIYGHVAAVCQGLTISECVRREHSVAIPAMSPST